MGNAAYNRGTQVLRDQITRDTEAKPKRHHAEIALHHAERINNNLKSRIASLEEEVEKAKLYLRLARAERDALKLEVKEREQKIEFYKTMCCSLRSRGEKLKRSWQKASCTTLISTNYRENSGDLLRANKGKGASDE